MKDFKSLINQLNLKIVKQKSSFLKKVERSLFFKNVHDSTDKTIYRLDLDNGKVEFYTIEEIADYYPNWNAKPSEKSPIQPLSIHGAYIHTTPYLTDINFNFNKRLEQLDSVKDETTCLNIYRHPSYLEKFIPDKVETWADHQVPSVYYEFLKHLFDDHEESVVYCYKWIAYSLDPRIKQLPFLCLVDAIEGVGKGILTDIIRSLHGEYENSAILSDRVFKSNFNSQIKGLTFACFNEANIHGKDQLNRMKALSDDLVEIEAKGKDSAIYKNFMKGMIVSNEYGIQVDKETRRFSILKTKRQNLKDNKKLLKKYGSIEGLIRELQDPKNIEKFGLFLTCLREFGLYKNPEESHLKVLWTDYSDDLVDETRPEWERVMIRELPIKIITEFLNAGHELKITSKEEHPHIDVPMTFFQSRLMSELKNWKGQSIGRKKIEDACRGYDVILKIVDAKPRIVRIFWHEDYVSYVKNDGLFSQNLT